MSENILETIHQCRHEIPKLRAALETRGIKQPIFTEPKFGSDHTRSILDLHEALSGEVNRLANRLQVEMGTLPGPVIDAPPPPAKPANPSGAPGAIALTSAEISRLEWTEKVQLAGGHMSIEKARTLAAERAPAGGASKVSLTDECLAARLTSQKDAPDLKGKNLTELCLAQSTEMEDRRTGKK